MANRRPRGFGTAGWTRWLVVGGLSLVALGASGCGSADRSASPTDPPWKASASGSVVTAAPDAGGALSFRNCPTLAEAQAAIPAIVAGPDGNAVPFKSMVLQCSYELPGRDVQGRVAGLAALVFDAEAEGRATWSWTLDGDWGPPTVIPDLGDDAFATHGSGGWDLWLSRGRFGVHLLHTSPDDLALDRLTAMGRAVLVGLDRPPR